MISSKTYGDLIQDFGNVASWTVWASPNPGTIKSNTDDLSMFTTPQILSILNNDYVFVGLNASAHIGCPICSNPWQAFHSSDMKRQRDYKLRGALKDTKFWGSYITDILKGISETNSAEIIKFIKSNPSKLEENINIFKQELKFLDNENIVIIAIGGAAERILKDNGFPCKKITHYSSYSGVDKYRQLVHSELTAQGLLP